MRVRIKKAFAGYRVGQEFDWADGMARIYIGRGMAEEVTASPSGDAVASVEERSADVIEEAAVAPRVERAVVQQKRRPK